MKQIAGYKPFFFSSSFFFPFFTLNLSTDMPFQYRLETNMNDEKKKQNWKKKRNKLTQLRTFST